MNLPNFGSGATIKLLLTLSTLVAGAGLVGGTVTNSSSQTENPSSFVAGTLVLSNTVESDAPCVSAAASLRCGRILGAGLGPGQVVTSHVTLQNIGVVPVGNLAFWIANCQSANNSDVTFHGSADLCAATQVTVHDDVHDVCYYPALAPGTCAFRPGATVSALMAQHGSGTPLALSYEHLGGGITYTVAARLDSAVGNLSQGRQETFDLVWQAGQG